MINIDKNEDLIKKALSVKGTSLLSDAFKRLIRNKAPKSIFTIFAQLSERSSGLINSI